MRLSLKRKLVNIPKLARNHGAGGPNRPLIEALEQRQLLSGTVSGLITDASSNPLSDARVRLISATSGGHSYFATTDASGDYVINHVADGNYLVKARDQGYVPNASDAFTVADGSNTAPTVELTAVVTGTVSGQVTDSNGNPLADAVVHLVLASSFPGGTNLPPQISALGDLQTNFIDGGGYGMTATTDANGDYVINNVLTGSYYIKAHDAGYTANTTASFTVAAGSNTAPTVQLFAIVFGTVSGQITDGSGNPLSGAQVVLQSSVTIGNGSTIGGKRYTATTDANGDYVIDNVLAGTYVVAGIDKGYNNNSSATFTVVAGSNTAPTVALTQIVYGTVTGQITDNNGNPLADASVSIAINPDSDAGYNATTNSNGDYTVKHVLAGTYTVVAFDNGFTSSRSASFTVGAGTNTAPTVQLTPIVYGTVTGQITDASGNPIDDATVFILVDGTPFPMPQTDDGGFVHANPPDYVAVGFTNSSGDYTIDKVPVGTYQIGASAKHYVDNTSAAFTVTAGSNTAPTVALTPKSSVTPI